MSAERTGNTAEPQHVFKVLIVGYWSAGKTSVVKKFCFNYFMEQYKVTIGLDFAAQSMLQPVMNWKYP
jgi:GTPase SAR1 family protein